MLRPGIQRWLEQHCESSAQVAGGVVVAAGGLAGDAQTVAEWPAHGSLTPSLSAAAQAALQRARPVVLAPTLRVADTRHNRVISLPLRAGDRLLGAVALAVQAEETEALEVLVRELTAASASLGDSLGSLGGTPPRGADPELLDRLRTLLLAPATLAEGALALLTELSAMLGCERASLAVAERQELVLVAVSNSADFKAEQGLLRLFTAAMHEAIDQSATVLHPAAPGEPMRIALAHQELRAATGHALGSWPLWPARAGPGLARRGDDDGSEAVGALLVERRGDEPLSAEQQALCSALALAIGPLVALRLQAERSWPARAAASARGSLARLLRRDDPWPKLVAVLALAAIALLALLPLPYRIGAPVRVEGAVQRVVAAPIDGFLGRSLVRPGDVVRSGDVLAELADTDLLLEQRRAESALAQHDNGAAAALARADRAQFVVSQGKAAEARAQLELLRQQLARTRLVAPMDGVVIKGDLSQALGAPVQRGDALLTLAPAQQFRLIVLVDERDIAGVRAGQTGQLALAAMPVDPLAFTVQRVTPVAVQRDGRNAFEVEARLQTAAAAAGLRPGLEGVARIDAGRQPLLWQWGHRGFDWLRLAWWSWAP